jgi:predicted DNA-binding transcriptional regulator AlpA
MSHLLLNDSTDAAKAIWQAVDNAAAKAPAWLREKIEKAPTNKLLSKEPGRGTKGMDKKVTIKQLQKAIGKSRTTIWQHMGCGMPHYKEGRYVYFDLSEVQSWLALRNKNVDLEIYSKAVNLFGDDKSGLLDYVKENADSKTYLVAALEVIANIFESNHKRALEEYTISGRTIYLLVKLANAMSINNDLDFSAWVNMLDKSIKEILNEVASKNNETKMLATLFNEVKRNTPCSGRRQRALRDAQLAEEVML